MATAAEKTVSATEFKAKCLDLMDQVYSGKLHRVRITRRGKPFVAVTTDGAANVGARAVSIESLFGAMKGTVQIPPDFDWEQSPFTDTELDEHDARFEEKFKHLL